MDAGMRDVIDVGNKTRKQLLQELAAAQIRLNELERLKDAGARAENRAPVGETHFAHLFKDTRIANLLFDTQGNLVSANLAAVGALGIAEYQRAVRESLFESAMWTPEIRSRLARGEVLRVRITLDVGALSGSAEGRPGSWPNGVAHLESTVSSLGRQGYLVQVQDITQEVESKAALRERETFFRSVFQAIPSPTVVWRHIGGGNFVLHFYNASAGAATEGRLSEYQGASLDAFFAHEPGFAERVRRSFRTGETLSAEQEYTFRTTGKKRYIRATSARVGHEYVIGTITDLTELKETQGALVEARRVLERSLNEKQILLQEVHHRVKNNLSILSSLIELQAAAFDDPTVREILRDTQARMLSVARVHEALYSSGEDTTHIDLADYVSRLGDELREAYAGQGVEIEYELANFALSQQRAIHFGLLVNELISNALKHAFPAGCAGPARVRICLKELDGHLRLIVKDNGVGLPENFDPKATGSLGVQVIDMLVDQMQGMVEYLSGQGTGTEVRVLIPEEQLG